MCVSLYFSGLLLLFKAFFKEGSRFFQLLNNFFLLKCQTKKQHDKQVVKKYLQGKTQYKIHRIVDCNCVAIILRFLVIFNICFAGV